MIHVCFVSSLQHTQPYDFLLSTLGPGFSANVDSARQNLASTFVNAFVNAGFQSDKLMTEDGIVYCV